MGARPELPFELGASGIIAVLRTRQPEFLPVLVGYLWDAGVGAVELPVGIPDCLLAIAALNGTPSTVGVGEVVDVVQADAVIAAGARFVSCPIGTHGVVRRCAEPGGCGDRARRPGRRRRGVERERRRRQARLRTSGTFTHTGRGARGTRHPARRVRRHRRSLRRGLHSRRSARRRGRRLAARGCGRRWKPGSIRSAGETARRRGRRRDMTPRRALRLGHRTADAGSN